MTKLYRISRFLLSKYSIGTIVILCTLMSIFLSLVIGLLVIYFGDQHQCAGILLTMHIVTPALVAPLITFPYIKSVYEIDLLRKQLDKLARIDELTGISNRRFFYEQAESVIQRSNRLEEPVSLMFIDIDYFKNINDTHGHDTGDKTLQLVADILKSQIRTYDIIGRYGGEEFLLLLPNTALENSEKIAERLRSVVEKSAIIIGDKKINVTVSVGLTNKTGNNITLESLVTMADNGVYMAKEAGRNNIKTVPGPTKG